ESKGSDINHYVALNEYFYFHISSISEAYVYFLDSGDIDITKYIVTFLVSRMTYSQPILTGIFAFIFGYFYSKNVFYLFQKCKGPITGWTWILIIIFMLIVPFLLINGFRFWTATHVYVFGLLPYLLEGKKRCLWFCGLSVVFHFAYLLPV